MDNVENYIFKEICKSYILFGIIEFLIAEGDARDDLTGFFYR